MAGYNHQFLVLQTEGGHGIYEGKLPIAMDGTKDYTWSVWMYKNTSNDDYGEIISRDDSFGLYVHGNSAAYQMEGYPLVETEPVLVSGRWIHLAVSYKNSGFLKMYVDGELIKAVSINGNGKEKNGACFFGDSFSGLIRSVRLYGRVLTDEEVLKEMNFPEEVKESMGAFFDFSKTNPVEEKSGKQIALSGDCRMALSAPCALFEQGSNVWILQDEDMNPGGNFRPYTIQTWIYLKPTMDTFQTVFENFSEELPYGMSLFVERKEQEYYARFLHGSIENRNNLLESSTGLPMRTWINLAAVFDGSCCKLYIDGREDCRNQEMEEMQEYERTPNIRIGSDAPTGNYQGENWFRGAMSRMEVWDRALSLEEIRKFLSKQPDIFSEGLQAELDFMSVLPVDMALGRSIGFMQLRTGAQITEEVVSDFAEDLGESVYKEQSMRKVTQEEKLLFESKKGQILSQVQAYLKEGIKRDEQFNSEQEKQADLTALYRKIQELEEKMEQGEYIPTQILQEKTTDGGLNFCVREGDDVRVVLHYTKEELRALTPYDLWVIELVVIILLGIANIIFGVKLSSIDERIKAFISQNLCNARFLDIIAKLIKVGGGIGSIWAIIQYFSSNKLWKALINLIFGSMIFWAVIRLVAQLISKYVSGAMWVQVATGSAELLIAVIAHIANMPQKDAPLVLHRITFSADTANVALRKSAAEKILAPQWTKEGKNNSQPFAYSLKRLNETKSATVNVQISTLKDGEYYIRIKSDAASGVMGEIGPQKIQVKEEQPGGCDICLHADKLNLTNKGFGKEHFCWSWQCSSDGKTYQEFAKTEHDVYLIPEEPSAPWNAQEGIWVDALDALLKYMGMQKGYDLSAKRRLVSQIAGYLYQAENFHYDISRQKSYYTKGNICYLSNYLRHRNNSEAAHTVNGRDQAALLTAFGNMLGCNLTTKEVKEGKESYVNILPVIPVGSTAAEPKFTKAKKYEVVCEDIQEGGQMIVTDASVQLKFSKSGKEEYCLATSIPFSGQKGEGYIQSFAKNPEKCMLVDLDGKYGNGKRIVE